MELLSERWYDAIRVRKSTRNFSDQPIALHLTDQLSRVAEELSSFCPAARAVIVPAAPPDVFKGVLGSYGAVQGAPACAAFIADISHPQH